MKWKVSCLRATPSRTKWKPIFMCLMCAWKMGLIVRYVVPRLSPNKIGEVEGWYPISDNKNWTQISSGVTVAKDLNSASILDLWTVFCFGALDIKLWPKDEEYPWWSDGHVDGQPSRQQNRLLNQVWQKDEEVSHNMLLFSGSKVTA